MKIKQIVKQIISDLKYNSDPKYLQGEKSVIKFATNLLGVRLPVINKISSKYYGAIKNEGVDFGFDLACALIKTRVYEMRVVAFGIVERFSKKFEKKHFRFIESWVKNEIQDWSDCDDLCNHAVGDIIMKFPELADRVEKWAINKKWITRRAAAVSFILPARRGFYHDYVYRIADMEIKDPHPLVQKGYGWALKEASRTQAKKVLAFIMKRKNAIPRTALRYAIELMPENMKKQAMKKTG